jgi:hypothetical protein
VRREVAKRGMPDASDERPEQDARAGLETLVRDEA